jgi:hypothetical protein
MASDSLPPISCMLCSKPVNLQTDFQADENGKAVHEDCYVKHIGPKQLDRAPKGLDMVEPPLPPRSHLA